MIQELNKNIGIITTVNNLSLYRQTVAFFPENFKIFIIDGSDGLYGLSSFKLMFKKLRKQRLKWLAIADEDVIFVNPDAVLSIINSMESNNEDVCGVRDGGILSWRNKNPNLINPFFCILNLEKIYSIYDEKKFLQNQYIIENEFNDDLTDLPFEYDKNSLFENYYCFFLWLRRNNFRFKFLNAESSNFENDLETTTVFDINNKIFLYHTWYARTYGKINYHTERIDNVIKKGTLKKGYTERDFLWYRNYKFSYIKAVNKTYNRIKFFFK